MGLAHSPRFHRDHRVLSRATWSGLALSRTLLRLLVATFAPRGPHVFGIDETVERRRGEQIAAEGISRAPVRSSHRHFVKARGRRWSCLMLLVPVPWADRIWALPFLTVPARSERYDAALAPVGDVGTVDPAGGVVRRSQPTFADALALVRRDLWRHQTSQPSTRGTEMVNVQCVLVEHLTETLCYVYVA